MTLLETLKKTKEFFEQNPDRWIQGKLKYYSGNNPPSFCLLGKIIHIAGNNMEFEHQLNKMVMDFSGRHYTVVTYNDVYCGKVQDVIEFLNKCIRKLEKDENSI